VFSPYYRRALRRDANASADDHCALNVCLYSPNAKRWTMTERGHSQVSREARRFAIGPSAASWSGDALTIDIDERCAPIPRRVRGRVTVHPLGLSRFTTALDTADRHRWGPIAPCARIEVDLQQPSLRWSGAAYIDSNEGDEPIDAGFRRWDWLRAALPNDRCAVVYDVTQRDGAQRTIAARFAPDGSVRPFETAPRIRLPPAPLWRMTRAVRGDAAAVLRTLEDTPFYARSLLDLSLPGQPHSAAVHESLDLRRLVLPPVQRMLMFRMPRRG
jgi:carotenoid 1,2-hydratase